MKKLDNPDADYADDKYTEETLARLAKQKTDSKPSKPEPTREK